MKPFYKYIAGCLILSMAVFLFPSAVLCKEPRLLAKSETKKITRHEPEVKYTSAKAIPVVLTESGETKKIGKWALIGLGAVAVIALVAGSGGGDDGGGSNNEKDEGTLAFEW